MNSLLERVNAVCKNVRAGNHESISFKKLIGSVRTGFKEQNLDIDLKTKKDKNLARSNFYVLAYYDADSDFNNETPIEVIIHHNFSDLLQFKDVQTTELLVEIYDATVHELRHQQQSKHRKYENFSDHAESPYNKYLADPDELDAYAVSIAIDLLRVMSAQRAKRYMSKFSVLAKMRFGPVYVSTNLQAYVSHFHNNPLLNRLAKKVYKNLEMIDKRHIFV
jgi:hypothetical protein